MDRITRAWITVAIGYGVGLILAGSTLMGYLFSTVVAVVWSLHSRGVGWGLPLFCAAVFWGALSWPKTLSTPDIEDRDAPTSGQLVEVRYRGNQALVLITTPAVDGLISYRVQRFKRALFPRSKGKDEGSIERLSCGPKPRRIRPAQLGATKGCEMAPEGDAHSR